MPISVERHEAGTYTASVTPSKYREVNWTTPHPLREQDLIDALLELGYHLQDIADAIDEADNQWPGAASDKAGDKA